MLPFPEETSLYKIHLYKEFKRVTSLFEGTFDEMLQKRKALVNLLNRSPINQIVWDKKAMSTGWQGLKRGTFEPFATPYRLTIQKIK